MAQKFNFVASMASLNSLLKRRLLFKWSIKTNKKFVYQERFLFGISTFWIFKMVFEGFLIRSWELFKAHFVLKGSCSQSTLLFLASLSLSLFGLFLGLSSFVVFLFLLGFLGHHLSYIVCWASQHCIAKSSGYCWSCDRKFCTLVNV